MPKSSCKKGSGTDCISNPSGPGEYCEYCLDNLDIRTLGFRDLGLDIDELTQEQIDEAISKVFNTNK